MDLLQGRRQQEMLRINQLKLAPDHTEQELKKALLTTLHLKEEELLEYHIHKRSIDARKKPTIFYSYAIDFQVKNEERILKKAKNKVQKVFQKAYEFPKAGTMKLRHRPIIVGAGPAGLFCAYSLAVQGYQPILVERGATVEERMQDVEKFWNTGILNPKSNVQFGEGGAGTFSDGKLNTLVKDKFGRNNFVLETFVKFGADPAILYEQKPHIGTDVLACVVSNMRREILSLGGEVRFHAQVTDFVFEGSEKSDRHLKQIIINNSEKIDCDVLILAIGHSARDTFQVLYDEGIPMQAKSFAVGVRIEHPQKMIQEAQYGKEMADLFPAAAYKLTTQLENKRGVYTFCMCPGGYVVNASSEDGKLAVNGMSYHDRLGENANSAVIVTVTPQDYKSDSPLAGIAFQRNLEERAYQIGQGNIPVQCYKDFCDNIPTEKLGDIHPQMKGNYRLANVRAIFPDELAKSIEQGILNMDHKIHGFAREDALLSGVESRTSSPVKILREESFESTCKGIYPCGEGAGYAGGITSAAMDGMKVAEAIIKKYEAFSS